MYKLLKFCNFSSNTLLRQNEINYWYKDEARNNCSEQMMMGRSLVYGCKFLVNVKQPSDAAELLKQ